MPERTAPEWAAIRRDYERGGETIAALCARHGIATATLYRRARTERWLKRIERSRMGRTPEGRRAILVNRLCHIMEEEVLMIEQTLARRTRGGDGEAAPGEDERRLRSLNSVLRTLDKLIQLDEQTQAGAPEEGTQEKEASTDADADRLRRDIAQRLGRLLEARAD